MPASHWSVDRFPISDGDSWLVELLAPDRLAILGQARVFLLLTLGWWPVLGAGTGNITLTVHSLQRERGTGSNYCKSFITRQLKRVFLLHLVPTRLCKWGLHVLLLNCSQSSVRQLTTVTAAVKRGLGACSPFLMGLKYVKIGCHWELLRVWQLDWVQTEPQIEISNSITPCPPTPHSHI